MSKLEYTPVDEIPKIHAELRKGYESGKMKPIAFRKYQLLQVAYLVQDNAERIREALKSDLGRPYLETDMMDIGPTIADAVEAYKHVQKWAKPEKPAFSLNFTLMKPVMTKEPKGVCLVISPFNYPLWLTLGPLCGALAAGNAVVLKPSEQTPAISALMTELIPKYLDPSIVRVVNGAIAETSKLLELPWGHILYTGSGRVGRIIASAAGKTLTPVTLELGGKSPVFVDKTCDAEVAARRILWGKVANAGQTCVAPDYIFVERSYQDEFIKHLKATYNQFYPEAIATTDSFSRIVTPQAWSRINNLLQGTKGEIVIGGETDESKKLIGPTIVKNVKFDDSLMTEEIFGPVLPIVPVDNFDEAIAYVKANDHPLVVYVFSEDPAFKKKIMSETESGGASANEVLIHVGVEGLPFGGIGPSGSGYHKGVYGFNTFSHFRATIDSPNWLDKILSVRYPPYSDKKRQSLARLNPSLPARPTGPPRQSEGGSSAKWWFFALALVLAAGLTKKKEVLKLLGNA